MPTTWRPPPQALLLLRRNPTDSVARCKGIGFFRFAMNRGFRGLIPLFIEAIPEASSQAAPGRRLTRFGQTGLAAGIALMGAVTYLTSWSMGESIATKLQFCPVLGQPANAGGELETLSLTTSGDATNLLVWNYRLNRELINDLKAATKQQKLLLNQQIASLTMRLSRQCYLTRYYRIQAGALTTVSTAAAVMLVITGLMRMPRGFEAVSRCEQAIFVSSLSLLVLTIGFLSLGGQQQQARNNWANHQQGIQLLSLIRSSLANAQLLLPPDPKSTTPVNQPPALATTEVVAQLVTRIDVWLLSVDYGSVGLNNSFARQTFDQLFQSSGQQPQQQQPVNPLLSTP